MSIAFDAMLGWDEGIRSQIICLANFLDPASVGDVRHPASGLATRHWRVSPPNAHSGLRIPTIADLKKVLGIKT